MPFVISKWKTKSGVSRASFKWRKKTKLSESSSTVDTITYGMQVQGYKAVAKLERLVKRLNKYEVDPEDADTINDHLDYVNKPTKKQREFQNNWLGKAIANEASVRNNNF